MLQFDKRMNCHGGGPSPNIQRSIKFPPTVPSSGRYLSVPLEYRDGAGKHPNTAFRWLISAFLHVRLKPILLVLP